MKRRFFLLQLLGWAVLVLLISRSVVVMGFMGSTYRQQSDQNRTAEHLVLANRGIILDRFGIPLVENTVSYQLGTTSHPSSQSDLSPIDVDTAFLLSFEQPDRLFTSVGRHYPLGSTLSPVVGYVGVADAGDAHVVERLDEKVGKSGIERAFDHTLRGVNGSELFEVSAVGKKLRLVDSSPPVAGADLTLSIDASLSAVAARALNGNPGSVVVSDIGTGQVLSLVSSPSFDPENITPSLHDPETPMLNRALGAYPPGSVFKMMVALAGLEKGAIQADTQITDEGQLKVGAATFSNWYYTEHGKTDSNLDVVKALQRSNDVFFYKLAAMVGPDDIAKMAERFHLGEPTGIELSESGGVIPTPAWKEKTTGVKWFLGDTYHMGIGQGDVLVTPLQLNAMTAALGRGGVWCQPTLFVGQQQSCEDLELKPQNLATVGQGMVGACSHGGTGVPFFAYNETASDSAKVACKTGTAEHGSADANGRRKTHAWFTMFYPLGKPKVAITVMLESTSDKPFLEGSADAAPIAKTVWDAWEKTYQ